jgi:hypothetical protein
MDIIADCREPKRERLSRQASAPFLVAAQKQAQS